MKPKNILKIVILGSALTIASSTVAVAAIPTGVNGDPGTIILGSKAYDINLLFSDKYTAQINSDLAVANDVLYYNLGNAGWKDMFSGEAVSNAKMAALPQVTYLNKDDSTTLYAAGNGDPVVTDTATVTSVSAIKGTITVTMSRPIFSGSTKPTFADFAVTSSGVAVTPTAISATGAVVTLTVPAVVDATTDQPLVYSVSYKGGAPVVSNIQVTNLTPNSVIVGQKLNAILYTNVGAIEGGYTWTYTTDTDALKFIQLNYNNLSEGLPISLIAEVFTFQATQAGIFELHFSMERPWEGTTSSVQTMDYIINVS